MLKSVLIDPGTSKKGTVSPARAVLVENRPVPPFGQPLDAIIKQDFLRDDNGSNDMSVVASPASPQIFSVKALPESDIYIAGLSFLITGLDMNLADFGAGAALTNPAILTYNTSEETVVIADDLTTNFDFFRLGGELTPSTGDTLSALKTGSPAMGAPSDDAYSPYVDIRRVYGLSWGVRLAAGSSQELALLIQDDTTGAAIFNCAVYAMRRDPDTDRS